MYKNHFPGCESCLRKEYTAELCLYAYILKGECKIVLSVSLFKST